VFHTARRRHRRYIVLWRRLLPAAVVLVFATAWTLHPPLTSPAFIDPASTFALRDETPVFRTSFASHTVDEFVHAPAITALPNGRLLAVWFAGSREGAKDVVIKGSVYDPHSGEWSAERVLIRRETTTEGTRRYIRKLGNPVLATAPNGRVWLIYVSVSLGGWATSSINEIHSDDAGETWSKPSRLITTPFANLSTLVRTAPVFHEDGTIGLPVYHEMFGKFAEYLRLDARGRVIDKARIGKGRASLQPTIAPVSRERAVALLRYSGPPPYRVLSSTSDDAGRSWSRPVATPVMNPNASLAAFELYDPADDSLLVVLNDLQDERFRLSVMRADRTLKQWTTLFVLDESPDPSGGSFTTDAYRSIIGEKFVRSGTNRQSALVDRFLASLDSRMCDEHGCEFDYEYPFLIRCPDGVFHVVYAWNDSMIKHVAFNRAWLELQR
jgi:predicted neuraminidase